MFLSSYYNFKVSMFYSILQIHLMIYLYAYVCWVWKTLIRGDSIKFYFYFTSLTNHSWSSLTFFGRRIFQRRHSECVESPQCEDEAAPAPEWNVFDMPECLTNEFKELNIISFKIKERVNSEIETSEPSCQTDSIKINSNYQTNLQTP